MTAVDAHGKHLFLRFEGGLTIHSHLRMTGSWRVLRGARWPRSSRRRGCGSAAASARCVQFNGPVLELMTDSRTRLRPADRRPGARHPGARSSTPARFLRRLREDDPTRPIGDALLDQRTIAGIGNLWKVEGCFAAGDRPVAPDRATSATTEALAIVAAARPRMQHSASTATRTASSASTAAAGLPCPRCGPTR